MLTQTDGPRTNDKPSPDRKSKPATPTQKLLTGPQIASEYGIPRRSVYDLHVSGKLPAVRFRDGGRMWFRRQDVEELIKRSMEAHR
jgi:excisionase family DNA binding protein